MGRWSGGPGMELQRRLGCPECALGFLDIRVGSSARGNKYLGIEIGQPGQNLPVF